MRKLHKYTQEEIEYLKVLAEEGHIYKEIAKRFNEYFNLDINFKSVNAAMKRRKIANGRDGCFKKGNVPFNKGKKGIVHKGCEKGWFKKGIKPPNYNPPGTERVTSSGYKEVKVADPNKWVLKHRLIWEFANGPVPKGHVVLFKDNDHMNCRLENLILASRAQLAVINKQRLWSKVPESKETVVLLAQLLVKVSSVKRKDEKECQKT